MQWTYEMGILLLDMLFYLFKPAITTGSTAKVNVFSICVCWRETILNRLDLLLEEKNHFERAGVVTRNIGSTTTTLTTWPIYAGFELHILRSQLWWQF